MSRLIIIASVFMINATQSYSQDAKKICRMLQGEWVSLQDSAYTIYFKEKVMIEKYKGDSANESFHYFISNKNCGVTFKLCDSKCFYLKKISTDDNSKLCYLIKSITSDAVTFVYEGGQVLDFSKVHNRNHEDQGVPRLP
jgi:hypothetical protein